MFDSGVRYAEGRIAIDRLSCRIAAPMTDAVDVWRVQHVSTSQMPFVIARSSRPNRSGEC